MCYGFISPLGDSILNRRRNGNAGVRGRQVRAIAAFARGFSPLVCVEFARRSIPTETRPEFTEMETHVKEKS